MTADRLAMLVFLVMGIFTSSGIMIVEPGEEAVVYRFGAVSRTVSAGLNYRMPYPIETHTNIRVAEIQRLETGSLRLLTGDTNLVDVEIVVQYTLNDAVAYQLGLLHPERIVQAEVIALDIAIALVRELLSAWEPGLKRRRVS